MGARHIRKGPVFRTRILGRFLTANLCSNVRSCEGFSDACRGWACAANSVGRRPRSLNNSGHL